MNTLMIFSLNITGFTNFAPGIYKNINPVESFCLLMEYTFINFPAYDYTLTELVMRWYSLNSIKSLYRNAASAITSFPDKVEKRHTHCEEIFHTLFHYFGYSKSNSHEKKNSLIYCNLYFMRYFLWPEFQHWRPGRIECHAI